MRLPTITPTRLPYKADLRSTTLREFTGGWNVSDDDMNLAPRFATKLKNAYVDKNGKIKVRSGTQLFARCGVHVIEAVYFSDSIVAVLSNGDFVRVLGDGTVLPLASGLWSATEFASFAVFNGHLIWCNGIDKPIDVDSEFVVEYLQDAATHTNINVPICKYVMAISRYLVMAGDPLFTDRVHITAKDAAGTWYGDPPPNDATRIDVGTELPEATIVRGLLTFRGKLVVMFAEGLVFGTLGATDEDGNHTPDFGDAIAGYGSLSHRTGVAYGDDALFLDLEGVSSIKRTAFSTSFKPSRVSESIDPEIKASREVLSTNSLENRVFSVHNRRDGQLMLFIPDNDVVADTTETRAFVYNKIADNLEPWCEFRGWNFTCGCRSLEGNIFFGDANGDIWVYTGDKDYADLTATPVDEGIGIEFEWELPWLDFANRALTKTNKYISFDTRGASEFTITMFIDNLLVDEDGNDTPALVSEFSAGEQGQFGGGPQPYGGGRNTSYKRKYAWPCKFEIAKLNISGTASEGLAFVSITMHYLQGGINL